MQRRTNENGGASQPKRAASIRAESTGPSPPSEKPQGQPASIRCVGATAGRQRRKRACEQHRKVRATHARTGARDKPAAKDDGRRRPTVEAGWSERWRLPTQNATWQASAVGDQNLKRGVRLVVHLFRLAAVRSTAGYATEARRTHPDRRSQLDPQCPRLLRIFRTGCRAVAGRCAEAHADDRGRRR
jgi:hypothetical protein